MSVPFAYFGYSDFSDKLFWGLFKIILIIIKENFFK